MAAEEQGAHVSLKMYQRLPAALLLHAYMMT